MLIGKRLELAQSLYNDPKNSPRDICKTIGISLATFYRYVRQPPSTPAPAPSSGPSSKERRPAKKSPQKPRRR